MGVHCEINLFKPADGLFIPGSTIAGVIKYAFDQETTIKKIIVSVKGSGSLRIKDDRRKRKERQSIYRNFEKYIDIDNIVQQDEKTYPVGLYQTNFSVRLPSKLPPSLRYFKILPFYHIRCIIGYYVRIKFEKPGVLTFNKHFKRDIKIVSGITPRLPKMPTVYEERKSLCHIFSCNGSVVDIKANVESCVITPGGKIELTYEVINDSRVVVKAVEFKLVEKYIFKPRGHVSVRTHSDVIDTDSKTGSIAAGQSKQMLITMNVPTDKTTIENSHLLSRDYHVRMTVVLPMPHFNCSLDIPVQIGEHYDSGAPPASDNYLGGSENDQLISDGQFSPSAPPPEYNFDDPPPSYWEVMGEHDEDDEKKEDSD